MSIKWGILGASGIAHRRTMPAINEAEGNELHALMVRDMDRAEKLAQEHEVPYFYDSVDDLLSDPEIDVIHVATPVYLHCEHVIRTAEHGKHVFCEKPMALSVNECKSMIDACEQNGVCLQVCFLLRFHPSYQDIKQMIDNGVLGEIIEARVSLMKLYPIDEGLWRRDPTKAGGGVIMDLGAHAIDLLSFLLGDTTHVTAFIDSRVGKWEVEDSATVIMKMESGAHAISSTSFSVPHGGNMLEIYGSKGSIIIGGGKIKIYLGDDVQEKAQSFVNFYREQAEHFAKYIEGVEPPIIPGVVGLKNMQIISAAYESVRTNQIVPIKAI